MSIASCKGKFVRVEARNPATVCCDEALLACALQCVGVKEHPLLQFEIATEEIAGAEVIFWRWLFQAQSACGTYQTSDLVKWWSDEAWIAANPSHEWAVLSKGLRSMAEIARRIRETVPRVIVRRGDLLAVIPANLSDARREHLLGQLDGRISMDTPFVEPGA